MGGDSLLELPQETVLKLGFLMGPLECDHLVVGAGSTGLAVVDHLLRREAGSVLLIDSHETPQSRLGAPRAPLIPAEGDRWSRWSRRGQELYEGWDSWLEIDPGLRRSGVLIMGEQSTIDGEILDSEKMKHRWSGLSDTDSWATFLGHGATVDAMEVTSALMWRMRKGGGRFHGGAALHSLEEASDGVHFSTSRREGFASHVFLCVGAHSTKLLEGFGVRHGHRLETVSEFTLAWDGEVPPLIHWPKEKAVLFRSSKDEVEIILQADLEDADLPGPLPDPTVCWEALSEFRKKWCSWLPPLEVAAVKRARARHRVSFSEESSTLYASAGGRIVMPGSCGEHSELLFPVMAEEAVEQVLAGSTGGLLEDLEG
ncbi:FAD-binding oxidoreductase [Planctomycetota bacterium]|nr:FAD-binding oxidoreductase [Planctomycetota bacterium]